MAQRKKFTNIEIPILEMETSALGSPESLENRNIKLDLTRKMRGKGLEVIFKLIKQDNKMIAIPRKLALMKFYLKRMMRKRISYVEDSFKTKTDDVEITIKPFLITRKKVSRVVRKNLRQTAREFLIEYAKSVTYLELCEDILNGNLQKQMLPRLKKVYPLSLCEIRVLETNSENLNFETLQQKPKRKQESEDLENQEASDEEKTEEKTKQEKTEENEEESEELEKKEEVKEKKKTTKKSTKKTTKKKE